MEWTSIQHGDASHDDVIKWKHFPRYWPFIRGIHWSPVNSPHQGQWLGALMFSLICVWINAWVNNREAGDLRRHRGHYDVNVMICGIIAWNFILILEWDECHGTSFVNTSCRMLRPGQVNTEVFYVLVHVGFMELVPKFINHQFLNFGQHGWLSSVNSQVACFQCQPNIIAPRTQAILLCRKWSLTTY